MITPIDTQKTAKHTHWHLRLLGSWMFGLSGGWPMAFLHLPGSGRSAHMLICSHAHMLTCWAHISWAHMCVSDQVIVGPLSGGLLFVCCVLLGVFRLSGASLLSAHSRFLSVLTPGCSQWPPSWLPRRANTHTFTHKGTATILNATHLTFGAIWSIIPGWGS